MADVTYSVEVEFLQKGGLNAPAASIADLKSKTDGWMSSMMSSTQSWAGSFNSALDSIGGKVFDVGAKATMAFTGALAVGLGAAVKESFRLNEEMENTALSIAAIASANGTVANFGGGMRIAGDVIKEMRADAAKLPGTFQDLSHIMATISSATAQQGIGMHGTEKMAADIMMASQILGVRNEVAAREAAMILEGNARHSMPFFNRLGMEMSPKDLNALAPEKRLEKMREALARLNTPEMRDAAANNWQGVTTTAIDNIRLAITLVGGPLFQSVKETIKAFNGLGKDEGAKEHLRDIGIAFGQHLDNAFHQGIDAIKHWYPIVQTFGQNLYHHIVTAFTSVQPIIQSILGHIENFMLDPKGIDKLLEVARIMIGLRLGGAVVEKGAGIAGSLLPALGGTGGAGAAVAAAAGPAAAAVGGLAFAAYGAFDILTDSSNRFHGVAMELARNIEFHSKETVSQFSKLGDALMPLVDLLGLGLLQAVREIIPFFEALGWAANSLVEGFHSATNAGIAFGEWVREKVGLGKKLDDNSQMKWDTIDTVGYGGVGSDLGIAVKSLDTTITAEKERNRKIPQHTTHINKVEIKVEGNQDPNRVARKTVDFVADLARHPKIAGNSGVPNFQR